MKNILATGILAMLHITSAFCQTPDSVFITVGQDTGRLEQQRFVSPYDEVFGINEPTRWLFKWNAASFLPALGFNPVGNESISNEGLQIDAEYKISPAFSLNVSYGLGFRLRDGLSFGDENTFYAHRFRVEPRWYFAMPKRIREGRGANNLSGNYFGLELEQESRINDDTYRAASVRFGIQRRLFRYGYFDMSYGVGVRDFPQTVYGNAATQFFADARLGVGLALASPGRRSAKNIGQCDVLQCFREEKRMWKIDLYNLLRVARTDLIRSSLRLAMEQKIGESPFSVGAQIQFDGSYSDFQNSYSAVSKAHSLGYGALLQGRYYYSMKRRIATGKSGNNLSGAYLAWQIDYKKSRTTATGRTIDDYTSELTQAGTGPLWGIQHRIFNHGFIDFNVGAGAGNERSSTKTNIETVRTTDLQLHFLGNLSIGLAF